MHKKIEVDSPPLDYWIDSVSFDAPIVRKFVSDRNKPWSLIVLIKNFLLYLSYSVRIESDPNQIRHKSVEICFIRLHSL